MKARFTFVLFFVLCIAVSRLQAQESGVQVGSATLFPTIGLGIGYDDNITLSPNNEVSSWYYLISPALRVQTGSERSTYLFEYGLTYVEYTDSDFDSYLDQYLSALWQYTPTVRDEISLRGRLDFGHDRRGEGLGEFFPGTLRRDVDEYETLSIDAFYRHGADGARGRIQLEAGWLEKEYTNNRSLTFIGDYDQVHFGGAFFWRVGNKSSLLVEAGVSEIDYVFSNRDYDENFIGVGVKWDATARTEGRASYRHLETDFDDELQSDYSGTAWEVAVRWAPKVYSVIEVSAYRGTDVAFGSSNVLVREQVDLSWRHEWQPRFATFFDIGVQEEDFRPGLRNDDSFFYGVGASYDVRYWLNIGLSVRHFDRDSSIAAFNYDRNEFLLSFELSL